MANRGLGYPAMSNQREAEKYLRQAAAAFGGDEEMSGLAGQLTGAAGMYPGMVGKVAGAAEFNPEDLAGQASVDTGLAYDKAFDVMNRNMARMGVNAASPRYAGLAQKWALARAAAEAGAKTRARRTGREEAFSRMVQAANLASGLPSMAMSAMERSKASGSGLMGVAQAYDEMAGGARADAFQEDITKLLGGALRQQEMQDFAAQGAANKAAWATRQNKGMSFKTPKFDSSFWRE